MAFDIQNRDLARYYIQNVRIWGPTTDGLDVLTDAVIAPLTTTAGLKTAVTGSVRKNAEHEYNVRAFVEAIDWYVGNELLSDANVAAANTFAGLIALMVANAGLTANDVEVFSSNYGGGHYMGNGGFGTTV